MKNINKKLSVLIVTVMLLNISGFGYASTKQAAPQISYYFSQPDHQTDVQLIKVIDSAKKTLDIAIYSITKPSIVNAITNAVKRGVNVRIITDKIQAKGKAQVVALGLLKKSKIPIMVNTHSGLMHLKVTIADNSIVTTGSYNYSKGATEQNDEVLVIINDSKIAQDFTDKFNFMWNDSKKFKNF